MKVSLTLKKTPGRGREEGKGTPALYFRAWANPGTLECLTSTLPLRLFFFVFFFFWFVAATPLLPVLALPLPQSIRLHPAKIAGQSNTAVPLPLTKHSWLLSEQLPTRYTIKGARRGMDSAARDGLACEWQPTWLESAFRVSRLLGSPRGYR